MIKTPEAIYHILWFLCLAGLGIWVLRILMRRF